MLKVWYSLAFRGFDPVYLHVCRDAIFLRGSVGLYGVSVKHSFGFHRFLQGAKDSHGSFTMNTLSQKRCEMATI